MTSDLITLKFLLSVHFKTQTLISAGKYVHEGYEETWSLPTRAVSAGTSVTPKKLWLIDIMYFAWGLYCVNTCAKASVSRIVTF